MQRDDIKKVLSALVADDTKSDAVEAAVSGLLNLFHGELNAAKKATEEAEQKAAKAAEIAATAADKDTEVAELRGQIDKLTAKLSEAAKKSNVANAVSRLKEAGMSAELAAAIAATTVSDDEKASNAAVEAILTTYSAQEQARAAEAAKNGMLGMKFPAHEGNGGAASTPEVELAERLGRESSVAHSGNGLADFVNR